MYACNFLSCVAILASSASTTVTGDSRRAAISAARRWAGRKLGSVFAAGIMVLLWVRGGGEPRGARTVGALSGGVASPTVSLPGPPPNAAAHTTPVFQPPH